MSIRDMLPDGKEEKGHRRPGFWRAVRCAGAVLAAVPVIFMLFTGLVGSIAAARPVMDVLLPAELAFVALPGMVLIPLGAAGERRNWRIPAALAAGAFVSLGLCVAVASLSGIAAGARPARGPAWWAVISLLAVYDLCTAAAPAAGLLVGRKRLKGDKDGQV